MSLALPAALTGAEVTIKGTLVTASVHGLHVETRITPLLAEAIWQNLGTTPGAVAVTIRGDAAQVFLTRDGIRVKIGPLSFLRTMLSARRRYLEVKEIAAREQAREEAYA